MSIPTVSLTEVQRQQLLEVLGRRFKKMADTALLELERLTRHPVDLANFQPKMSDVAIAKAATPVFDDKNADGVIDAAFSTPISRREFIAYSASGLLGLLLCGADYGWSKSNDSVENLSAIVAAVGSDINSLTAIIGGLQATLDACNELTVEFLNAYPQTLYSIARFKENIEKTKSLYSQLDETGMTIAEIIQFVVNIVSFVPDTENYTQPVNAMLDVVKNIPDTVFWAEQALTNLEPWFSDEQDQGINSRLLFPMQSVLHTIDNDIRTKLDSSRTKLIGL